MENPFELQQKTLLARIATNIAKLGEVLEDAELKLNHINTNNEEVIKLSYIFDNYHQGVAVHFENEQLENVNYDDTQEAFNKAARHRDMNRLGYGSFNVEESFKE